MISCSHISKAEDIAPRFKADKDRITVLGGI
jgi:hypothetical protein